MSLPEQKYAGVQDGGSTRSTELLTPYPDPLQESQPTTSEPHEYPEKVVLAMVPPYELLSAAVPERRIQPSQPPLAESAFAQPVTVPLVVVVTNAGAHGAEGQPAVSAALNEIHPIFSLQA